MQTVPPSGLSGVGIAGDESERPDQTDWVYITHTAVCLRLAQLEQICGSEPH